MTALDKLLNELEDARKAATHGEWFVDGVGTAGSDIKSHGEYPDILEINVRNQAGFKTMKRTEETAEFICAAANLLPQLIKEVRKLQQVCEMQREALEFYSKGWVKETKVIQLNPKIIGEDYVPLFSLRNDNGSKARQTLAKVSELMKGSEV